MTEWAGEPVLDAWRLERTREAMGLDEWPNDPVDIDAEVKHRPMMPPDIAGEAVTAMVKANAEVVLGTKQVGAQRIKSSRNALSESAYSHFELVSMLAVALDRLAVWEALTPRPDIEQVEFALNTEIARQLTQSDITSAEIDVAKLARAVLDR